MKIRLPLVAPLTLLLLAAAPLAAEEEGFVDLLADADLSAWVAEPNAQQAERWSLEEGVLRCAGKRGGGFMRYENKLCDFTVRLEYRMTRGCNSGIGIRGTEYDGSRAKRPSFAGYELQILDDSGKAPSKHSSTSLYRYVAPTENASRPHGEWNVIEITCRGPRIEVVLNDKKVHDIDQQEHDAIRDKPLCGYFSLQNHGKQIEFRNVRLKELAAEPAAAGDAAE